MTRVTGGRKLYDLDYLSKVGYFCFTDELIDGDLTDLLLGLDCYEI